MTPTSESIINILNQLTSIVSGEIPAYVTPAIVEERFDCEFIDGTLVEIPSPMYFPLTKDEFIDRIGGQEKIDAMNKINEKLDRSDFVNGKLVPKREGNKREDLDEWKRGFMEGYDEAYRRLMDSRS